MSIGKATTLQRMKKQGGGSRDKKIRKEVSLLKGTFLKKYNHMCDLIADEETHWWVNQWLRAYPPTPGGGNY
tara:strand:- start:1439 stop:1654 length:216 start_codon:yes stop_codon:yes gene_type:complete